MHSSERKLEAGVPGELTLGRRTSTGDSVDKKALGLRKPRTQRSPPARAPPQNTFTFSSANSRSLGLLLLSDLCLMKCQKGSAASPIQQEISFFLFSFVFFFHGMPSWRSFATLDKYFSVNSNGKELVTSREGHHCLFMELFCKDKSGSLVCAQR